MIEKRPKVLGALLYPIVLTVLCFAIISILLVFVVPKVTEVFDSYHAQLPFITRVLIAVSNFFRGWGIWMALAMPVLIWLAARQPKRQVSQERELDGPMTALVGLLGPLMIVVMGLFVVGIVFAMLLPIFQMNNLIR